MSRTKSNTKSTSYHHGNLRESLIEAALVILERDGADSLSLRAIAAEVGVSHTAPYSHFKNKKELIEGVSEAGYELLADSFDESVAAQGDNLEDTVLNYGASYLQFALDNPQLYRLMLGQVETRGLKESLSSATLDMTKESITLKRPFKMLFKAFEEKISDPELASYQALGAWGMVHGISALLIEGHLSVPKNLDLKSFLAKMTLRR
ncbi:TetR/AcrR family transcriptional regulator [Maricurvus nonylphenolicus]|uniref:TetR/AcrR family transcriptional regulator n=1 Tax=Maricurvus nonylphenolicus TaxID=1008307 RepID=UPI0036F20F5F